MLCSFLIRNVMTCVKSRMIYLSCCFLKCIYCNHLDCMHTTNNQRATTSYRWHLPTNQLVYNNMTSRNVRNSGEKGTLDKDNERDRKWVPACKPNDVLLLKTSTQSDASASTRAAHALCPHKLRETRGALLGRVRLLWPGVPAKASGLHTQRRAFVPLEGRIQHVQILNIQTMCSA